MGLFGFDNSSSSSSSSTTNNDNRDQRQSGDNGSINIGSGASAIGIDPSVVDSYNQASQAIAQGGTDAVKTLAQFGSKDLANLGDSVVNLLGQASSNAKTVWEHTVDQSAGALNTQSQTASALAQQAVLAANPNQSANTTITQIAMYAALALAAFFIFRKKAG